MRGYSEKCQDLKTYLLRNTGQCVPCRQPKPGYEITPNCGFDDNGGRHEPSTTRCKANFFNDGSNALCQPCASCPDGFHTVNNCTATTNTQCQDPRSWTTEFPARETTTTTSQHVSTLLTETSTIQTKEASSLELPAGPKPTTKLDSASPVGQWAVPFAILIVAMLVALSTCIIYMKRKRGLKRSSSYMNVGFSPLPASPGNDILSPEIMSAPLKIVLDNLDVLEELVILLDPENRGIKNTKHLASHCSFPSTWINYTYSMKDSKSPLKAVLEGVTSKHPDWTIGELAKLLKQMERNDAIAALAKLRLNKNDI